MLINNTIEIPDETEVVVVPVLGEYEGMLTYWNFKRGAAWVGFDYLEGLTTEEMLMHLSDEDNPEGYDWEQLSFGEEADFNYDWS